MELDEIKGVRITTQGLHLYRDKCVVCEDSRGKPYYWIGGELPTEVKENGTDYGCLKNGIVSVTPLHLELTDKGNIEDLKDWNWLDKIII